MYVCYKIDFLEISGLELFHFEFIAPQTFMKVNYLLLELEKTCSLKKTYYSRVLMKFMGAK